MWLPHAAFKLHLICIGRGPFLQFTLQVSVHPSNALFLAAAAASRDLSEGARQRTRATRAANSNAKTPVCRASS
jgi:hypothetical protein